MKLKQNINKLAPLSKNKLKEKRHERARELASDLYLYNPVSRKNKPRVPFCHRKLMIIYIYIYVLQRNKINNQ